MWNLQLKSISLCWQWYWRCPTSLQQNSFNLSFNLYSSSQNINLKNRARKSNLDPYQFIPINPNFNSITVYWSNSLQYNISWITINTAIMSKISSIVYIEDYSFMLKKIRIRIMSINSILLRLGYLLKPTLLVHVW